MVDAGASRGGLGAGVSRVTGEKPVVCGDEEHEKE